MPEQLLICTDLDRTLLPNGSQPESPWARVCFAQLAARPEITLAYVSGRHRELVEEAIREYRLPKPDWVVGDVGSTIYRLTNTDWQPWSEWEQAIAPDWRGKKSAELRSLFHGLPPLRLQEETKQNTYKLSYYLPLGADIDALEQEMQRRLEHQNLSASLIYSVDETTRTGLLDVLPARATKLHAIEFLMTHQGFSPSNTLFAGDSGNDLPVLVSAIPSVLVANATSALTEQARTLALKQGTESALYIAQGGFLGMNGNYSAGILEGVSHFYPDIKAWLENSFTMLTGLESG